MKSSVAAVNFNVDKSIIGVLYTFPKKSFLTDFENCVTSEKFGVLCFILMSKCFHDLMTNNYIFFEVIIPMVTF